MAEMGDSYLWSFFLKMCVVVPALYIITRIRLNFYESLNEQSLVKRDPFASNLYGLCILISWFIFVRELFDIINQIDIYDCLDGGGTHYESGNCLGNFIYSDLIASGNSVDIDLLPQYLGSLFIPIIWFTWALVKEFEINKAYREVRLKMLLGQIPSLRTTMNSNESLQKIQETFEENRIPKNEVGDSATFEQVLAAMDLELKKAIQTAEVLQLELNQTKEKVEFLEEEVQIKDDEIEQIKATKTSIDKLFNESKSDEDAGKSLSLTDSVMVGDSVMGGVKIDNQINNDPEAIARAVINAYRKGLNDS